MKKTILFFAAACMIAVLSSCSEFPGYDQTDDGLYYKFYDQVEDAEKAELGDVLTVSMCYSLVDSTGGDEDSLIFHSDSLGEPSRLMLMEPAYKGDISEGLAMMGIGDSASFIVNADSFYIMNIGIQELPSFIPTGSNLKFEIKLISIQKKAEYEKEQKLIYEKYNAWLEERKAKEPEDIKSYLKDSSITVSPTATGLYYKEKKRGTGVCPVKDETVSVHYTGRFLDGTIFDSSLGGEPIEFVVGSNQVIPGWEEGILLMRTGGKATFVIPSELAYGATGAKPLIYPYTPLVFDVELVKIK